jgi:hypothetical protein
VKQEPNLVVAAARPALPIPTSSSIEKPNIIISQDAKNGVFLQLVPQTQDQAPAPPSDIAPLPMMEMITQATVTAPIITTQTPESVTKDEHGFTAEQLAMSVQANSLGNLPCERDQQTFLETGMIDTVIPYDSYGMNNKNRLLLLNKPLILGQGFNPKCDENGDYFPVQCQIKKYNLSQTYRQSYSTHV